MLRIKSIRVIRIHSWFGIILLKVQKLMMTRTVTLVFSYGWLVSSLSFCQNFNQ